MRRERPWVRRILALATATAGFGCGATATGGDGDAAKQAEAEAGAGSDATAEDVIASDAQPDVAKDVHAPDVLSVRRPFLVGSSLRAATASVRDDWSDELPRALHLDHRTRAALAHAWLEDGLQEHASIAAFARFSMLMLGVGAPPDLVTDAQRASIDEVRHARACFSLARRYGSKEAGPAALRVDDTFVPTTLAELAALTAEEGCVGETLGALLAEEQARVARDPVVRRLLERIARDEARHAELAWRFVAWAVATGGAEVLRRVEAAAERALATTVAMRVRTLAVDDQAWAAHGRLSCTEARAIARRGALDVVLPALRALRGGAPDLARSSLIETRDPARPPSS
jgi:hypothetical protein